MDADVSVSSWEPVAGAPSARSDYLDYEEDYQEEAQGPSYAYGALRLRELVREWEEGRGEAGPTRGGAQAQADQGPSYAYGALGSRFQLDSVVVDTVDTYAANFPAPKKTQYD